MNKNKVMISGKR